MSVATAIFDCPPEVWWLFGGFAVIEAGLIWWACKGWRNA